MPRPIENTVMAPAPFYAALLGVITTAAGPSTAPPAASAIINVSPLLSPELSSACLRAAATYSNRHGGVAFLVIQNNRVLLEDYQPGGGPDIKHKIYSGTKGFWTMAGLAAGEDGLLQLDEHVSDILPAWQSDPLRSGISLRELLNFTSGLEPDFHLHSNEIQNRDTRALKDKMIAGRGGAFIYGPAAMQVYHEVLKSRLAAWSETPTAYLERRILYPLGLGSQRYMTDGNNNPLLASGFALTAREWASLGLCLLHRGWPVLAGDSLSSVLSGSGINPAYSHGFWNNHAAAWPGAREIDIEEMLELDWYKQNWRHAALCCAAPADLFASIGSAGQRLYIVPSKNLVIVRLSHDSKFKDYEFLRLLFAPN